MGACGMTKLAVPLVHSALIMIAVLLMTVVEGGTGNKNHQGGRPHPEALRKLHRADAALGKVGQAAGRVANGVNKFMQSLDSASTKSLRHPFRGNLVKLIKRIDADAKKINLLKLEKKAQTREEAVLANSKGEVRRVVKRGVREQRTAEKQTQKAAQAEMDVKGDLQSHPSHFKALSSSTIDITKSKWADADYMKLHELRTNMNNIAKAEKNVAKQGEELVHELGNK